MFISQKSLYLDNRPIFYVEIKTKDNTGVNWIENIFFDEIKDFSDPYELAEDGMFLGDSFKRVSIDRRRCCL